MDLKCKKTTCKYNNKYSCHAKNILIGTSTECTTYEKAIKLPDKIVDASKTMFEAAPEIEPYRHIKDVKVGCNAKICLFNKDGRCNANGITVLEGKEGYCGTFIKEKGLNKNKKEV